MKTNNEDTMTTENKPTAPLSAEGLDEMLGRVERAATKFRDITAFHPGHFRELENFSNDALALIAQARAASPLSSPSIESLSRASGEEIGQQAQESSVEDAQDAAGLSDGYEGGFYSNAIDEDGIGKFTLYYKSAEQAEAAFTLVMRIIDAAMSATQEGK